MRRGRLLAEESPRYLMDRFKCETLEDVFIYLSIDQNLDKRRRSIIIKATPHKDVARKSNQSNQSGETASVKGDHARGKAHVTMHTVPEESEMPPVKEIEMKYSDYFKCVSRNHMKALMWKNALWMWRNYVYVYLNNIPVPIRIGR